LRPRLSGLIELDQLLPLAKPKEAQDSNNDNYETDDIDDVVHVNLHAKARRQSDMTETSNRASRSFNNRCHTNPKQHKSGGGAPRLAEVSAFLGMWPTGEA
jgi:hypothetical protein